MEAAEQIRQDAKVRMKDTLSEAELARATGC